MARGKIVFTIGGGTPPYRVLVINENNYSEGYGGYFETSGSNKEIEIAEDASSGSYRLDIIDYNGCIFDETITIGSPTQTYTVTFESDRRFKVTINGFEYETPLFGVGGVYSAETDPLPGGTSYSWSVEEVVEGKIPEEVSGTVILNENEVVQVVFTE